MFLGITVLNTRSPKYSRSCFSTSLDTLVRSEKVHRTPRMPKVGFSWVCLTLSIVS